ncbi:guanitoxin biosynthesis heme-dependent pre-guanitoxin N-hydroxylase GntA [Sphingomonas floccifaciens]|uniref:Guanitoxin biosynthesis heme-dependent pre-guanitoxin N-hydroxylase GntA n=1 Tax=Sphingomonas floccifaciens TaxID=1844115 RepID=A0ABW4NF13_9SPHN
MQTPAFEDSHPLALDFQTAVRDPAFPCVGAKSALSRGNMRFLVARSITSAWDDLRVHAAIRAFVADYRADPTLFRSFILLFEDDGALDETGFESAMWDRLQSLSDKDEWLGQEPDPRVSDDPDDPHFSLSFAGEGFFVVGLHPNASRPARRFPRPALVFNLHDQFERLRAEGKYEKLRTSIIDRDVALAGSVNPMLARHGTLSEARQYSGRAVDESWRCPFSGRRNFSDAA